VIKAGIIIKYKNKLHCSRDNSATVSDAVGSDHLGLPYDQCLSGSNCVFTACKFTNLWM